MAEHDERRDREPDDEVAGDPSEEEQDPESAPASDPPPGQDPDEGKQHDL